MSKDLYAILGVSKTATAEEIKKAYKKLVVANHPDTKTDPKEKAMAEKKLAEINDAYGILSDTTKKQNYDRFGSEDGSGFGHGSSGGRYEANFDFGNINDIFGSFGDFFNQGSSKSNKRTQHEYRGSDLRYKLNISLKDAFYGIKDKIITFLAEDKCKTCSGTGSRSNKGRIKCSVCNGNGAIRMQQGFFIVEQACHSCNGEGVKISDPCSTCSGSGIYKQEKKVKFDIPSGIENDSTIKIKEAGEAGQFNGKYGDLYIQVFVSSDKTFKRDGNNLIIDLPIKFTDAALGANLEIAGIDGNKIKISIPKGSQSKSKITIKDAGMTILNKTGKRGDLIAELHVEIPTRLTSDQEILLRQFDHLCSKDSHPKTESFFDSIKNLFS